MSNLGPPARPVPLLDLVSETETLWDELTAAIHGVLRSGHYIMGPNVGAFETELCAHLGVRHAVTVNSGTDALVIALRAMGVGPGDEVITSAFTFFATAEAVSAVGATPVFVDIEPDTFNLDVSRVEAALTPRTRCIIPVHVFGQSADLGPLLALAREHRVRILEDSAQSFGATYGERWAGTLGDMGAWSFFPTKNLGTFGDGGLITTDDDDLADAARMLRVHGARRKYHNEAIGYNSRLDELHAAILRVKLPRVSAVNEQRRAVAARYGELLAGLDGVTLPAERPYGRHVYNQYTIRIAGGRRDGVQRALAAEGVGTMIYYPIPQHRLPVYAHLDVSLPVSEAAAAEVLSLPITPTLDHDAQARVADALRRAL